MQLILVYGQFYTSFSALHRQFIYNLANIFKFKPHSLLLILIFRYHRSRRSRHRVVNAQPGDLPTLNVIFLIYFSRQIDYYTNTVLTILTRSTTGPVNFYFIFAVFHTELLMHSQEYNTHTPYLSDCAVHRVPLHKSTKDTSI